MSLDSNGKVNQFFNQKDFFDYPVINTMQRSVPELVPPKNERGDEIGISDYLVAFSTQSQSYCVGCVDMVNSTKISAMLGSKKISEYYELFLNSMSKIIGRFDGKVIKNVGDCLVYYFPSPNTDVGFRNCLSTGLAMIEAQSIICDKLKSKGLPCISYRISADYGNVIIMNTNNSKSIDMIGPPVNMCTKINHCAKSNEFVIGGDMYERVKNFEHVKLKQVTGCNIGFKLSYPVYKVVS